MNRKCAQGVSILSALVLLGSEAVAASGARPTHQRRGNGDGSVGERAASSLGVAGLVLPTTRRPVHPVGFAAKIYVTFGEVLVYPPLLDQLGRKPQGPQGVARIVGGTIRGQESSREPLYRLKKTLWTRRVDLGGNPNSCTDAVPPLPVAIYAHRRTGQRVLVSIAKTVRASGFTQLCLMAGVHGRAADGRACVPIALASPCGDRQAAADKLRFNVTVGPRGFTVAGAGGVLPGGDGGLPTIKCATPLRGGRCPAPRTGPSGGAGADGYAYGRLAELMRAIKKRYPSAHELDISADQHVPVQVLLRTLDALSGVSPALDKPLFDRFTLRLD